MFKIIKKLTKKQWLMAAVSMVFIVVQVWLDLKLPDYMAKITRLVQTPGSAMSEIIDVGLWMLACALGSMLAAIVVGYIVSRIGTGLSKVLRESVFQKTVAFSMEEISNFSTPSLVNRTTNDITQVQMFITVGLQALIKAPITAVWAIQKIVNKSWQWSLVTIIAVVFLMLMLSIVIIFAIPKFKIVQKLNDNLNRVTRENLNGIRVVYAYNAHDYQANKFEKVNQELTQTNLYVNRIMALLSPSMALVMSSVSLEIYWAGAMIINQASSLDRLGLFSDMVVFSSYAIQVIMAFVIISMTFIILPRALVSANRINEVLDTVTKIEDGPGKQSEIFERGSIEFKNVSFRYPDAQDAVLSNISFTAQKGETVAFIGSTGSGKSTLINLVPRFYDATDGEILVDGVDIKTYTQAQLRDKIGYVSQKAVLFKGTLKSNIAYGETRSDSYSYDRLVEATEIAQAKSFIDALPDGFDAPVAQGGTNFSGGQKQRIAFARAIYRNPSIFVFDDSFSALDYKTDRLIRERLKEKAASATKLIVAQRISTILDADKIIVLDDGHIVGIGRHHELLQSCPVYLEIAQSQLSQEELNHA